MVLPCSSEALHAMFDKEVRNLSEEDCGPYQAFIGSI
jgi:hypothetical protein